jgi:hypothetical protein
MRMTVVIDGRGDGHAVLMIRTDRGDLILDNQRAHHDGEKVAGFSEFERLRGALFLSYERCHGRRSRDVHLPRMWCSVRGHKDAVPGAGEGLCRVRLPPG